MNFASDNHAGVHPEILAAISSINHDHVKAYGDDDYTSNAIQKFKSVFGDQAEVFFVFNGTAANVLGLQSALNSYESILCAQSAHIHVDECGAPEKFIGSKLLSIQTPDGKLTPELILPYCIGVGDQHHVQPRVISIAQSTEYGTIYSTDEVRSLAKFAHQRGMLLHMDGARISNAAAALGIGLKEATVDLGVDILSFGGTKNGALFGEAVLFFKPELAKNFKYIRKQGMQLASKMRFLSIQLETLLRNDLWLRNAKQANEMAQFLFQEVSKIPSIQISQKPQANAVFAVLPSTLIPKIQEKYLFYVWKPEVSPGMDEVRWMTSFNTSKEDVLDFVSVIKNQCP
jgi:threonine aldolase